MQNFTGVSKRKPIPRSISRKVVFHVKVIKQRYQNQCLQTHHPIAISLETSIAGFCYMKTKLRIALYEETLFVIQIAEEFIFFGLVWFEWNLLEESRFVIYVLIHFRYCCVLE